MHLSFKPSAISALLFAVIFSAVSVSAQQISTTELIAKHLDSIGGQAKRDSVRNFFVMGDVTFKLKGSANLASGKGMILSEKGRAAWAMTFNSNSYPQDKFAFDGKKVQIIRTTPEGRSFLTQFINDNKRVIEDGILSGVLSSRWIMRGGETERLKVDGKRKFNERDTIVVEYISKGSDARTKMFFDAVTFQHVRSEHTVAIGAVQGPSIDSSAGQSGTIIKVTEEFSDFKKMGDLLLPSSYRISYSRSGAANISTANSTAREAEWTFKFTDFGMNQDLSADAFSIGG